MFDKISLTLDGYVCIRWHMGYGITVESYIDPDDVPGFIAELMRA